MSYQNVCERTYSLKATLRVYLCDKPLRINYLEV